jgi:hypothetical protein
MIKPITSFIGLSGHFFEGFVLMKLWEWFASPVFHIAPIGYWQAMGLNLLINVFVFQHHAMPDYAEFSRRTEDIGEQMYRSLMVWSMPSLSLLFGFIFQAVQ